MATLQALAVELSGPLQQHLIPKLNIDALGSLACTCRALRQLVEDAPDPTWAAAANSKLPQEINLLPCDRTRAQTLLNRYSSTLRNLRTTTFEPELRVAPAAVMGRRVMGSTLSYSRDGSAVVVHASLGEGASAVSTLHTYTEQHGFQAVALPHIASVGEPSDAAAGWVDGGEQLRWVFASAVQPVLHCTTFGWVQQRLIPTGMKQVNLPGGCASSLVLAPGADHIFTSVYETDFPPEISRLVVADLNSREVIFQHDYGLIGGLAQWDADGQSVAMACCNELEEEIEVRVYDWLNDSTEILYPDAADFWTLEYRAETVVWAYDDEKEIQHTLGGFRLPVLSQRDHAILSLYGNMVAKARSYTPVWSIHRVGVTNDCHEPFCTIPSPSSKAEHSVKYLAFSSDDLFAIPWIFDDPEPTPVAVFELSTEQAMASLLLCH